MEIKTKKIISFMFSIVVISLLMIFSNSAFGSTYNVGNDYSLTIDNLSQTINNTNLQGRISFTIRNTYNHPLRFNIMIKHRDEWNTFLNENSFLLNPNETKKVNIVILPNKNYNTEVITPDMIQISVNKNLLGNFNFPITISDNNNQNITLNFQLNVVEIKNSLEFKINIPENQKVSPVEPFKFSIKGFNINQTLNPKIFVYFNDRLYKTLNSTFTQLKNFNIYNLNIDKNVMPGKYKIKVNLRVKDKKENFVKEWNKETSVLVMPYQDFKVTKSSKSNFFEKKYNLTIFNDGNIESNYVLKIPSTTLLNWFFFANKDYTINDSNIIFRFDINKGQKVNVEFGYNYIILYIILLLVLIALIYLYYYKNSNPIETKIKFYDIVRTKYEGVKSFKVKIELKNTKKKPIDELRLIFRMPTFLNVKKDSFLLVEPNSVLKSSSIYKLVWKFKDFGSDEVVILGFRLENNKGILGDIRFEDLELEIKYGDTLKKYFKILPIIKG